VLFIRVALKDYVVKIIVVPAVRLLRHVQMDNNLVAY
jgi:hypothetical protein